MFISRIFSQDTFSIVAADSTTREVGSAGASCLDLFAAGFSDATFIGDLIPDTGAINTQSFYLAENQKNARARMRLGETPAQIIGWIVKHDAGDNFTLRQYGIAGFNGNVVSTAGFTGSQSLDYKEHRTGSIDGIHYAIQGNILKGKKVIDSMEARFRNAQGDLACRLMAALQGANMIGSDARCTPDGTSSLFAYVKVAKPTDIYGSPSLKVSVRTQDNSQIEPIDSLQVLFDLEHSCSVTGLKPALEKNMLNVYPNPANQELIMQAGPETVGNSFQIRNTDGKIVSEGRILTGSTTIDIAAMPPGLYFIYVEKHLPYKFLKM